MGDKETVKYFADKSKELLDRQLNSYRQKQSNTATIMGINAIFIPLFLGGLSDSYLEIKILSILPILGMTVAICLLLQLYSLTSLKYGLDLSKYDEAVKKEFTQAMLAEIGNNRGCFNKNAEILAKKDKIYNWAFVLTMASIVISIILLSINLVFKPKSDKIKIELSKIENTQGINSRA